MSESIYDIPLNTIDGQTASIGDYRGSVALVVNVASRCGLTPQYDALEKLYAGYRDQGLVVLGFPANDFAGQEPGTNEEIQEFCRSTFGVDFPMFAKIAVNGEERHPLYSNLIAAIPNATPNPEGQLKGTLEKHGLGPKSPTDVMWNFEKFLLSRDGQVVGRFAPDVTPDSAIVMDAIKVELAK